MKSFAFSERVNVPMKKRPKELIIIGWLVFAFASFLFYCSTLVLGEFVMMPWSFGEILQSNGSLRSTFLAAAFTQLFSLLFFVAGVGILYVKRWAVILLFFIFVFNFIKRFYLMIVLSYAFNRIFVLEIILFLFSIFCFSRQKTREHLR